MAVFNNIYIICNPTAGWTSSRRVSKMLDLLLSMGLRREVLYTRYPGHAFQLAIDACQGRADLLIVAGGDGTLNEVVNGLLAFRREPGGAIPTIAVFPAGTANLVAAEMNMPYSPDEFIDTILANEWKTIWPVKMNQRYFLSVAGVGFDAYIVGKVPSSIKRKFSKLVYLYHTVGLLINNWQRQYEVEIDGITHAAVSVIVMNGRYYANCYDITPAARLTDPRLHVCIFKRSSRWLIFTYLIWLCFNSLSRHKHVEIHSGKRVCIKGPSEAVQVDGDLTELLPIQISAGDIPINVISA